MRLFSNSTNFPFMKLRFFFMFCSAMLIAFGMFHWNKAGINKYSVDFLGGTEIIVHFDKFVNPSEIRTALEESGIHGAVVQSFQGGSNDFTIRLKGDDTKEVAKTVDVALAKFEGLKHEFLKQDYVGPVIGEKIRKDAIVAIALSILIIGIYVTARFEWRFAVGACIAIVHDIFITAGIFVFFNGEIGAAFLAAILTVVGYSINDTIIIFDRVRENILESRAKKGSGKKQANGKAFSEMSLIEIFDISVNQTLSRTILTSATAVFVTAALCAYGGGALYDLSWALLIGIVFGTYSSVFIASPAVLLFSSDAGNE